MEIKMKIDGTSKVFEDNTIGENSSQDGRTI